MMLAKYKKNSIMPITKQFKKQKILRDKTVSNIIIIIIFISDSNNVNHYKYSCTIGGLPEKLYCSLTGRPNKNKNECSTKISYSMRVQKKQQDKDKKQDNKTVCKCNRSMCNTTI